jgi:hypothetical protein
MKLGSEAGKRGREIRDWKRGWEARLVSEGGWEGKLKGDPGKRE